MLLLKWLDSSEAIESYFRFPLLHRKHSLTMAYSRNKLSLHPIVLVAVDLFCKCNWKIRFGGYGLDPQWCCLVKNVGFHAAGLTLVMDLTFYVRTETKIFRFGKGSRCWTSLFQTMLLEKIVKLHALWKVLVTEILDTVPFLQEGAFLFQSLKRPFCNLDWLFFKLEITLTVFWYIVHWYNSHSLDIASVLRYPQMPTVLLDNWPLGLEFLPLASSPEMTSFCLKISR